MAKLTSQERTQSLLEQARRQAAAGVSHFQIERAATSEEETLAGTVPDTRPSEEGRGLAPRSSDVVARTRFLQDVPLEELKRELATKNALLAEYRQQGGTLHLDPDQVEDRRPVDRLPSAYGKEALASLVRSIERAGQGQTIAVKLTEEDNRYQLIDGRRRLEACRLLGRKVLALAYPAEMTREQVLYCQYALNEERQAISHYERAHYMKSLMEIFGSQSAIAASHDLSEGYVSKLLAIAERGEEIMTLLIDPRPISFRALLDLATLLRDQAIASRLLLAAEHIDASKSAEERLEILRRAATSAPRPTRPRIRSYRRNGKPFLRLAETRSGVTLKFSKGVDPALVRHFAELIIERADAIETEQARAKDASRIAPPADSSSGDS